MTALVTASICTILFNPFRNVLGKLPLGVTGDDNVPEFINLGGVVGRIGVEAAYSSIMAGPWIALPGSMASRW